MICGLQNSMTVDGGTWCDVDFPKTLDRLPGYRNN